MRDIENDSLSGKKTLVVHIGRKAAKIYHLGAGFSFCSLKPHLYYYSV